MDFGLNEEQRMLRDSMRKLMAQHAPPAEIRRLDEAREFPERVYQAWVDGGFFGLPFAEEFGGAGGDLLDLCVIIEEIGRVSADFVMAFSGTLFCGLNLVKKGSDAQKRYWIPKLLSGEVKFSVSISEPDAGSDVGAMRTSAVRDGTSWVLNGRKCWATGAGSANNVMNIYVRTGPAANYRGGLSLFLVDKDTPGLTLRKLEMLGRRSVGTYEVVLDDVRVPEDRLVGGENKGWDVVLSGLQVERVAAAAANVGAAQGVVDLAAQYAKDRSQFGRPIGSFQAIGHMIADMATEVEAARALTLRAAQMVAAGHDALRNISMAKLFASETFAKVANMGMQVLGANGYSMEFDMQRWFRDSRAATIAGGTSQMQRNLIAGTMGLKVQ